MKLYIDGMHFECERFPITATYSVDEENNVWLDFEYRGESHHIRGNRGISSDPSEFADMCWFAENYIEQYLTNKYFGV